MGVGRVGRNEKIPVRKKKKKPFVFGTLEQGLLASDSKHHDHQGLETQEASFFFFNQKRNKRKRKTLWALILQHECLKGDV